MNKREWKKRYIKRLVKMGLEKKNAKECYQSGKDTHDYDDSPEDAADDEAYYWACDTPH